MQQLIEILRSWSSDALGALFLAGAGIAGWLLGLASTWVVGRALRDSVAHAPFDRLVGPIRILLVLVLISAASPFTRFTEGLDNFVSLALRIFFILDASWFVLRGLLIGERLILLRFPLDVQDNLRARRAHTQIRVVRRILAAIAGLIAVSVILMSFDSVRQLGTTLLASAGVAGIIVGFAAQKSLGLILAGLQVALTQPIRLDDVVVVEGEWGWIEQITLTYVVVRIWDRRRLILPVTYFIDTPFQNWTRSSADLLGSVYLYVDYRIPVDELRERLHGFLKESEYWNGEAWVLQVVGATEKTVELRALMTAKDSPTLWNLRCEIREKLITYVQEHHPHCLPRARIALEGTGSETGPRESAAQS
jgi:small-conductance mechanosensitive channel